MPPLNSTLCAPMIQIRPGDLIAVRRNDAHVVFAILTKQILFGGHWSFVFHRSRQTLPAKGEEVVGAGFNAVVDFIVPKREGRVVRINRANDFSSLMGPELLQQEPAKGETNYGIWRWINKERMEAEYVRFTPSPTREERAAPRYSCMPADFAWHLAERKWNVSSSMWGA